MSSIKVAAASGTPWEDVYAMKMLSDGYEATSEKVSRSYSLGKKGMSFNMQLWENMSRTTTSFAHYEAKERGEYIPGCANMLTSMGGPEAGRKVTITSSSGPLEILRTPGIFWSTAVWISATNCFRGMMSEAAAAYNDLGEVSDPWWSVVWLMESRNLAVDGVEKRVETQVISRDIS